MQFSDGTVSVAWTYWSEVTVLPSASSSSGDNPLPARVARGARATLAGGRQGRSVTSAA